MKKDSNKRLDTDNMTIDEGNVEQVDNVTNDETTAEVDEKRSRIQELLKQRESATASKRPNNYDYKKSIERHRRFKVLLIVVLIILLITIIFGAFFNASQQNSYKIVVDGAYGGNLTLSFEPEFKNGFSVLKGAEIKTTNDGDGSAFADGVEEYINKVVRGDIKMDIDPSGQQGSAAADGMDQYVASKFYLKNDNDVGQENAKCKLRIDVQENMRNAFAAARFMIVLDTENSARKVMCAQPATDGSQEKVATLFKGSNRYYSDPYNENIDWLCENFTRRDDGSWYFDSYEHLGILFEIPPQNYEGFCVAVWYEGSDPDHNDSIIGGYITFMVTFSQIN